MITHERHATRRGQDFGIARTRGRARRLDRAMELRLPYKDGGDELGHARRFAGEDPGTHREVMAVNVMEPSTRLDGNTSGAVERLIDRLEHLAEDARYSGGDADSDRYVRAMSRLGRLRSRFAQLALENCSDIERVSEGAWFMHRTRQ